MKVNLSWQYLDREIQYLHLLQECFLIWRETQPVQRYKVSFKTEVWKFYSHLNIYQKLRELPHFLFCFVKYEAVGNWGASWNFPVAFQTCNGAEFIIRERLSHSLPQKSCPVLSQHEVWVYAFSQRPATITYLL